MLVWQVLFFLGSFWMTVSFSTTCTQPYVHYSSVPFLCYTALPHSAVHFVSTRGTASGPIRYRLLRQARQCGLIVAAVLPVIWPPMGNTP